MLFEDFFLFLTTTLQGFALSIRHYVSYCKFKGSNQGRILEEVEEE